MWNGLGTQKPPEAVHQLTKSLTHQLTLKRQIVVIRRRRVVERRTIPGRRRLADGGRRTSSDRRGIWTGRTVTRRPDHSFASRSTALARLVPALEVGRSWVALGLAVIPHRAAADRAEGHPVGVHATASRARICRRGRCGLLARCAGSRRGRRRARRRRSRPTRRPDHTATRGILALEVRGFRVPLSFPIVPHRSLALGTGGGGRRGVGGAGLSHLGCG
jgi:hypothetical protein